MATVTELEAEIEVEAPTIEPDEHYEVVDGRIVEKPPLGAQEGGIASLFVEAMGPFARSNRLGRVVAEVLFVLEEGLRLRQRPDVAYVSGERWPVNRRIPRETAWNVIPDLAVEITSPTDPIDDLMNKIQEYFNAGVRRVWVVYSKQSKVYDYESPTKVRILQLGDELVGGTLLPGFQIPLTQLFETEEGGPTPIA
jgi:Uma2 family endonuclease